eukprot:gb/GECG01002739.1/.p1 GENE.gb/GECG01002739.1/~~gb/GECG01002739.1/.p1  ORF type:complete len:638 (+),score=62.82 gb/GECG01002739.1/:1-1914(+)
MKQISSSKGIHSEYEEYELYKKTHTRQQWYIIYVTAVGAIGGLLFGYDTGVISGALLSIDSYFSLTDLEKEAIVSITVFGAMIGALFSGCISDRIGRKLVVMLASVIFVGGAVLMGIAQSLFQLLAGRLIVGLAIGQASMIVPMYIAEMAPSRYRGRLVTVNTFFITGGQFLAALVDGAFSGRGDGWRYMLGLGGVPALLQFFGLWGLPESPRYLVAQGKFEQARKALETLRGTPESTDASSAGSSTASYDTRDITLEESTEDRTSNTTESTKTERSAALLSSDSEGNKSGPKNVDEIEHQGANTTTYAIDKELKEIQDAIYEENRRGSGARYEKNGMCTKFGRCLDTWKLIFKTPAIRRAFIVGCTLQLLQQSAGINTVMYYSGTILHNAGFESRTAIWLTAVVAFANFSFSGLGLRFVETQGRRRLTLASIAGVTVSLILLGVVFYFKRQHSAMIISPPDGFPESRACQKFAKCMDCVLQDDCGFFGNRTSGYCLKGDRDGANKEPGDGPTNSVWGFSHCPGQLQQDLGWGALAALVLYLIWFAPGLAAMPWTINSEIYPNQVRAVAVSVATTVNWVFNLLVSMTFLSLATTITPFGSFCVYAGIAFLGGVFLFFRLPETKGKTLEEIQELFAAR